MIVLDDLDFTEGCSEKVSVKIFKNLVTSAQNAKKIFVICADFTNSIEFSNDNDAVTKIKEFKNKLEQLSEENPRQFYYSDHEHQIDYSNYHDDYPINETDNFVAISNIVDDLEELPRDMID